MQALQHPQFIVRGGRPARRHVEDVAARLKLGTVAKTLQQIACLGADLPAPCAIPIGAENRNEGDAVRKPVVGLGGNAQVGQIRVGDPECSLDPAKVLGPGVLCVRDKAPLFSLQGKLARSSAGEEENRSLRRKGTEVWSMLQICAVGSIYRRLRQQNHRNPVILLKASKPGHSRL